jgi:hypothetical protein
VRALVTSNSKRPLPAIDFRLIRGESLVEKVEFGELAVGVLLGSFLNRFLRSWVVEHLCKVFGVVQNLC